MPSDNSANVTRLLLNATAGDEEAVNQLLPIVYGELRRIAGGHLKAERIGHTLQPTALVHEAYLKLINQNEASFQSRSHFFSVAAQMMRRILIDYARTQKREKRGGGLVKTQLDEQLVFSPDRSEELLRLDDALEQLAKIDPQQAKVVELRFFGGLTVEETAEALGIGSATVKREWSMAKSWLYRELAKA